LAAKGHLEKVAGCLAPHEGGKAALGEAGRRFAGGGEKERRERERRTSGKRKTKFFEGRNEMGEVRRGRRDGPASRKRGDRLEKGDTGED